MLELMEEEYGGQLSEWQRYYLKEVCYFTAIIF